MTQLLTLTYISYVERPHMQKIYGGSLRGEAGLTKFIKRSMPGPVKGWQESVDRVLDDTTQFVQDFIDSAHPKFASGVKTIVRDTTALFNIAPARLTLTKLSPDLAGLDPKQYTLQVQGTPLIHASIHDRATGKESFSGRFPKHVRTMVYEYGAPLRVKWRAPAIHSQKDWIGLYMVTDNRSRETTEVPSLGRWAPTNKGAYDELTADCSIVISEQASQKSDPSEPATWLRARSSSKETSSGGRKECLSFDITTMANTMPWPYRSLLSFASRSSPKSMPAWTPRACMPKPLNPRSYR